MSPGLYISNHFPDIMMTVVEVLGDLNGRGTITVFGIVHCDSPTRWESEVSGNPGQYEMVFSDWTRVDL